MVPGPPKLSGTKAFHLRGRAPAWGRRSPLGQHVKPEIGWALRRLVAPKVGF